MFYAVTLSSICDISAFVAVEASLIVIPSSVNFKSAIVTSRVTAHISPSSSSERVLLLRCLFSSGVVVGIEEEERFLLPGV